MDTLEIALAPSASQREAIEAEPRALLVLAGPGAGKTFCLIERIRYLVEELHVDPARICAFTFTNKAAGEISHRLESRLGDAASKIKRGTIHAFCAEVLREAGTRVGLEQGFGIADEDYQVSVLRRLKVKTEWCKSTLTRFSAYRFRGTPLHQNDVPLYHSYEHFLQKQHVVDYDTLVIKAAELLEDKEASAAIRARWDVVLVDEFQDLNPAQYRVIKALSSGHNHVFAVGDDEQSIYSWAGADPQVFRSFLNDFEQAGKVHLEENRRCPRDVFELAHRFVSINPSIFDEVRTRLADREPTFPITVQRFESDEQEREWIVDDVRRDRDDFAHKWGDVALLYRTNEMGNALEAAFLNAGIPCRLAQGRALAEDPVVAYVIAAARVIANPADTIYRDDFLGVMLPKALFDAARAQAQVAGHDLLRFLDHRAKVLPKADDSRRQIRRALSDLGNLAALGKRHTSLSALVQELLSRRVGRLRSVLDERHDEIADPASLPDVVALSEVLRDARDFGHTVVIPRMGGVEIALKGMLAGIGINRVELGGESTIGHVPSVGIALGMFKAAQLLETRELGTGFGDFTALDLETTDKDTTRADIIEIAAVRVRNGVPVAELSFLVKPRGHIPAASTAVHGIRDSDVAHERTFAEIWPEVRAFLGGDIVVAHNGYDFDFRVLTRMVRTKLDLSMYDSLPLARDLFPTSRKLVDLARQFHIDPGNSHRALDDTRALALVMVELDKVKVSRARKTALVNLMDHLGVALALSDQGTLCPEALMFRDITVPWALGRYSTCLEYYEREQAGDETLPSVDEIIIALGGVERMVKIRMEKTADERYPVAMLRLRRLITELPEGTLAEQLVTFLERAVLSKWDGHDSDDARVNLLTLHSTKGLEFSRVYVVGVEDAQLPGGAPTSGPKPVEVEEARRLLYVGMTRTKDRLVMTRVAMRNGKPSRGTQFLDEMGLK
ncbi:MAG: UvrD-helicase domain-containing protein [Gemmatimonadaceae bacterium]